MPLRPATPADIPALHALVESAYRGDSARAGWTHEANLLGGQRTDPEALATMIAAPAEAILLDEAEGTLLGCVHLKRISGGTAYLGLFTVAPHLQGSGRGKKLLAAAEGHATRHMRAHRMEMTVIAQRAELIAWYERRGYARTGETRPFPLDDARFGLPMRRDLSFIVLEKALPG
ncbi:MAG: GNAT family N-acetyltransferase [Sphingobium sp.]|nr:GNAT family N-acetyltransferase [Sphingobium sp.]